MKGLLRRFDAWVSHAPYTSTDLSIFRVLFALLTLLTFPSIDFVSEYPRSLFDPPWGPFDWLSGPPGPRGLLVLELLTIASLIALMVGLLTPLASIATGVGLIVCGGLSFSYGKTDHTILLAVVPLVLCWSSWGTRYSADALRRKKTVLTSVGAVWPLRLLALCIGVAFATSGIEKVRGGWLELERQSAQWHMLRKFFFDDNAGPLAPVGSTIEFVPLWEAIDWLTVLLELLILVAVLNWRAFRLALAVATLFHLLVALLIGISFSANVIAYGAFVAWYGLAQLAGHGSLQWTNRVPRRLALGILVLAIPVVTTIWGWAREPLQQAIPAISLAVVIFGSLIGSGYLVASSREAILFLKARSAPTEVAES